jgi:succinyl-CoA synthetase beta subunit
MKLFEFEAKKILARYGVKIPRGQVVNESSEAGAIAGDIDGHVVLKSQILVSGRGKAGGIVFTGSPAEVEKAASNLIGSMVKGSLVESLLVEEKIDIAEQLYASVAIDRQARSYIVLASTSGGVDVEEVAQDFPEKMSRHRVEPALGFSEAEAAGMISALNISGEDSARFVSILSTLYKVATDCDAELVEINPLARTTAGEFVAADARMIVDDNALFRHPEFRDRPSMAAVETPWEAEARRKKLAYVDLSGDIGIIGNGAGLVMATLDLVHLFGGKPANFLDIGGGAQADIIKSGVLLVMSKPEVRAVLINILGGITRCDIVAQGVIDALGEAAVKKPIAVRMIGTNEEEGTRMLHQAGIHAYPNMEWAVEQVLKM